MTLGHYKVFCPLAQGDRVFLLSFLFQSDLLICIQITNRCLQRMYTINAVAIRKCRRPVTWSKHMFNKQVLSKGLDGFKSNE